MKYNLLFLTFMTLYLYAGGTLGILGHDNSNQNEKSMKKEIKKRVEAILDHNYLNEIEESERYYHLHFKELLPYHHNRGQIPGTKLKFNKESQLDLALLKEILSENTLLSLETIFKTPSIHEEIISIPKKEVKLDIKSAKE